MTVIRAALTYFAIVLGMGFVLGVPRVLVLVPRLGERWAELIEMPVMATVIFLASGFVLRRYAGIRGPGCSLAVGALALALTVGAELGLAAVLDDQTPTEFVKGRDPVSGLAYFVLLLAFGAAPRLRLPSISYDLKRQR